MSRYRQQRNTVKARTFRAAMSISSRQASSRHMDRVFALEDVAATDVVLAPTRWNASSTTGSSACFSGSGGLTRPPSGSSWGAGAPDTPPPDLGGDPEPLTALARGRGAARGRIAARPPEK